MPEIEKISDTISIINDGIGYYYWVKMKKENMQITGKIYQDRGLCIDDAKKLDAEKNKL